MERVIRWLLLALSSLTPTLCLCRLAGLVRLDLSLVPGQTGSRGDLLGVDVVYNAPATAEGWNEAEG